jgi:molybdopterin synthase sulfurtransferase
MTTHQRLPNSSPATVSAAHLRQRLGDPALTIVDVRPLAAYNGWRLRSESRGGHIPGAVAFPTAWLTSVDEAEFQRELTAKGVVPERAIVYGDGWFEWSQDPINNPIEIGEPQDEAAA